MFYLFQEKLGYNAVLIAIPDQTKAYQRLEKDVIARRKLAGATSSFKSF